MRIALSTLAGAALALGLIAGPAMAEDQGIVVYNAQHESLAKEWAKGFTKETGIKVTLRNGGDSDFSNQIVAEGAASPADVFLTENSPAMALVEAAGLFAPVDAETLAQVPQEYQPSSGKWVGVAARSTVFAYNKDKLKEDQLPKSLLDLADPSWKGRWAASPSGADFQAIVSAVLATQGEAKTAAWLKGLAANGTTYDGNDVVLQSVNDGEVDAGIIYHYYWYRDQAENGENSDHSALHFFGHQDPGAFVSISGAGVLVSSDHPTEAQQFVNFLASREGQQAMAGSYALEYPLNPKVDLGHGVKPFGSLQPPKVDPASLNSEKVVQLMQDAGLL